MNSSSAAADWYVARDGAQIGPISRNELQAMYTAGKVGAEDYVWSAALGDWKPAVDVLGSLRPPPPPPPAKRAAVPVPQRPIQDGNAGKFVKPNYDYDLVETGDTLTFTIRTRSKLRVLIALVIAVPLIIFAWFATIMGLIYIASGGLPWVVGGLISAGLTYYVFKWGYSKSPRPAVVFDREGIRMIDKYFSFDHISHIGHAGAGGSSSVSYFATGAAATGMLLGAAVAEASGHHIYIVYGSERIVIVQGLDSQNVDVVYDTVCKFLRQFGHQFG